MKIPVRMVTALQIKYIEGLLISVGITERTRRNAYLDLWTDKKVKFIEELTLAEAGTVIDELKRIKEEQNAIEMENAKWTDRNRR